MSQNFQHAMAHCRGARPKVRNVCRPNEAMQQENLYGPSIEVMQEEVEKNLKFYENLINDNFAPRDRGAMARGGNSSVPSGSSNTCLRRCFRATPFLNRTEEEECLRPPFSRPNQRGLCAGLPSLGIQLPDTCATRNQRSCSPQPTGSQIPVPAQGTGLMQQPVNQMAWQPRTINFPDVSSIHPPSQRQERPRPLGAHLQATWGSTRTQDQLTTPPDSTAGSSTLGHSHLGHDSHQGHHGHLSTNLSPDSESQTVRGFLQDLSLDSESQTVRAFLPNFGLDTRTQTLRGLQQAGDVMEGHHHHDHHHHQQERQPVERDEKTSSALRHLVQFRRSPSYMKCDKKGSLEFLEVCNQKVEGGAKAPNKDFPRIPCLQDNAINDLITCEKQDVESTLYLASDEKKTYKKPCPKQQKAQMTVKALVHAHAGQTCGKEYSPMEHPDPDDISPEVAAAMMFCQEQGIDMAGCPKLAINFLFPEEAKPPFPEKIPPENISVVGPDQGQQEDMIERSATVSAEGVSDSAYTRTMKEKGEDLGPQKSYDVDFAVGQTKREYVLVAQKPQRVNRAQFRGGASPSWFPGYFAAFPDEDGTLKLVPSPSRLLHRAWVHSKPVNMPQSDIIVVD